MTTQPNIQQIIDQAKQQRAELIGSALGTHAVPIAIAAAVLSFALFASSPSPVSPERADVAAVVG